MVNSSAHAATMTAGVSPLPEPDASVGLAEYSITSPTVTRLWQGATIEWPE
jgi:hypothetical protein